MAKKTTTTKKVIKKEPLYSDDTRIKILNVIFEFQKFAELREDIDGFLPKFKKMVDSHYSHTRKYINFDAYITRISKFAIENLLMYYLDN